MSPNQQQHGGSTLRQAQEGPPIQMTIEHELNDLEKVAASMHEDMTVLEQRASPFLRSGDEPNPGANSKLGMVSQRSNVAERLLDLCRELRGVGGRIRDVAARIDF